METRQFNEKNNEEFLKLYEEVDCKLARLVGEESGGLYTLVKYLKGGNVEYDEEFVCKLFKVKDIRTYLSHGNGNIKIDAEAVSVLRDIEKDVGAFSGLMEEAEKFVKKNGRRG